VERRIPEDLEILDVEPIVVTNPYTGAQATLEPDAVAVYDWIKGSEVIGHSKDMETGLEWFRKHEPAAYRLLLD
jgi:hypothetical protein|tara:strand:- start:958 stop:1179 length:222 start_codon:yes stop_codon:yes gene_type:complete